MSLPHPTYTWPDPDPRDEFGLVALDREEVHQGRLRRYYRLTEDGSAALDSEAQRLASNARIAAKRLRAWRTAGEPA